MKDDIPRERFTAQSLLLLFIGAMCVLPPLMQFNLNILWILQLYAITIPVALALAWVIWRQLLSIRPLVEVTMFVLMSLPPILVCSFAAMRTNLPLQDQLLVKMDRALGFDWPAFVRLVDSNAAASNALGFAYESAFYQLVLLPAALCVIGIGSRAYRLTSCYVLLVGISSVVAIFLPSVAAYRGYGFEIAGLRNIDGTNGHLFLSSLEGIRNDPNFVLGPETANGVLTFPSVHAGIAALLVWAAWPSNWLRYPIALLNVLMMIASVTHGAHYLVDVLAGLVIAAFVVPISGAIANAIPFPSQELARAASDSSNSASGGRAPQLFKKTTQG